MPALALLLATALAAAAPPPTAADVVGAAEASLRARLQAEGLEAELSAVGTPRLPPPTDGEVALVPAPVAGRWPRERVAVPVEYRVDGERVARVVVWFSLRLPRHGWVLARDLPRHARPDAAALVLADYDAARLGHEGEPLAPEALEGRRLAVARRAGAPLRAADLEPLPDVARDEPVLVRMVAGRVSLQVPGRALGEAHIGQRLQVLVEHGEGPVEGVVTAKGVVDVER